MNVKTVCKVCTVSVKTVLGFPSILSGAQANTAAAFGEKAGLHPRQVKQSLRLAFTNKSFYQLPIKHMMTM